MISLGFICFGVFLSCYYLLTARAQMRKTIHQIPLPEAADKRTETIVVRFLSIIVTAYLFFGIVVAVEPIVGFIGFIIVIAYSVAGLRNVSQPFTEQMILYHWSNNRLAPIIGILVGLALLLLSAISVGSLPPL
ncbi:MAG: hypothetical protein WBP12_01185 [Candidatus Saccharimonas sp.]